MEPQERLESAPNYLNEMQLERAVISSEGMTRDSLPQYLKVAKSTLCKPAQSGEVPVQKVGKHWRFHRGDIDR